MTNFSEKWEKAHKKCILFLQFSNTRGADPRLTSYSVHRSTTQMSVALHSRFFTERMWYCFARPIQCNRCADIRFEKRCHFSALFIRLKICLHSTKQVNVRGAHNIPKCIVHARHIYICVMCSNAVRISHFVSVEI